MNKVSDQTSIQTIKELIKKELQSRYQKSLSSICSRDGFILDIPVIDGGQSFESFSSRCKIRENQVIVKEEPIVIKGCESLILNNDDCENGFETSEFGSSGSDVSETLNHYSSPQRNSITPGEFDDQNNLNEAEYMVSFTLEGHPDKVFNQQLYPFQNTIDCQFDSETDSSLAEGKGYLDNGCENPNPQGSYPHKVYPNMSDFTTSPRGSSAAFTDNSEVDVHSMSDDGSGETSDSCHCEKASPHCTSIVGICEQSMCATEASYSHPQNYSSVSSEYGACGSDFEAGCAFDRCSYNYAGCSQPWEETCSDMVWYYNSMKLDTDCTSGSEYCCDTQESDSSYCHARPGCPSALNHGRPMIFHKAGQDPHTSLYDRNSTNFSNVDFMIQNTPSHIIQIQPDQTCPVSCVTQNDNYCMGHVTKCASVPCQLVQDQTESCRTSPGVNISWTMLLNHLDNAQPLLIDNKASGSVCLDPSQQNNFYQNPCNPNTSQMFSPIFDGSCPHIPAPPALSNLEASILPHIMNCPADIEITCSGVANESVMSTQLDVTCYHPMNDEKVKANAESKPQSNAGDQIVSLCTESGEPEIQIIEHPTGIKSEIQVFKSCGLIGDGEIQPSDIDFGCDGEPDELIREKIKDLLGPLPIPDQLNDIVKKSNEILPPKLFYSLQRTVVKDFEDDVCIARREKVEVQTVLKQLVFSPEDVEQYKETLKNATSLAEVEEVKALLPVQEHLSAGGDEPTSSILMTKAVSDRFRAGLDSLPANHKVLFQE